MGFARYLLLLLLLPAFALAADKSKAPAKPAPPPAIAKLLWLAGNWRLEKNNRLVEEQWMVPAGGVMLGMGRTVAKGKVVEYEFLQIREGPGGALFYIAQPSGQKEAAFQAQSLSETAVVFENQLHDFPQKVTYALQPDGSLLALIEGVGSDGQAKRVEFGYQRVSH
jgi:Domain of unknown function (DUF6265)